MKWLTPIKARSCFHSEKPQRQESGAHLLGCSYNAVVSNMIGGNYQSPWCIKAREARLPAHLRAKVIAKEASRDDAEAAGPQGRHRERMCLFPSSELGGNNTIDHRAFTD